MPGGALFLLHFVSACAQSTEPLKCHVDESGAAQSRPTPIGYRIHNGPATIFAAGRESAYHFKLLRSSPCTCQGARVILCEWQLVK